MHNSSLFSSPPGLLLLLLGAVAALYFGATAAAAFVLLLFALCLSARLWSGGVLDKTEASLGDGQTACHAGDTLTLSLQVSSRSLFPLVWLDVFVPLGQELILCHEDDESEKLEPVQLPMERPVYGFSSRFAWLLWQHEIACEETLLSLRRGVVEIDKVSLQAGDGLAMSARQKWQALSRPVRLSVYPKLVPVDVSPFARQIADAQAGARGQTEDVTLLRSSRPYQHGDPMRRINWRHLAASGRMETNQFETITPGCITFLVDLESFRYFKNVVTSYDTRETLPFVREEPFEAMLSFLASAIRALEERSLRYALIIPGHGKTPGVVCRPGSGETALLACMEALAALDYRGQNAVLPADELRRLRRELGVVHLCALSGAPASGEALHALGLERHRVIACRRDDACSASDTPVTLIGDLSPALGHWDASAAPKEGGAA